MEEFQLSKFTKEGAELLAGVKEEFERLHLDLSNLPKVFPDDKGKIKLVFVGQYSAGKSSIIKMLTGEDVEVGAKITTQSAAPYAWNGLEIIDTPGIHTELRPDHDELTYEQINHAVLLIFVITNEGFSQRMGDHFRELAINQKRAGNMVLVVNKMDRTANGNTPEQQNVIYEDLKKVTEPYDPKNLYLSFLNTEAYFDSLDEPDPEIKSEYLEESGHDVFVENLNRFVEEKGVLEKINKPLNTIAAEIRAQIENSSGAGNKDIAAFIETIEKRKKILDEGKEICLRKIEYIAETCEDEIAALGMKVADEVLAQKSEEEAKLKFRESEKEVEKITRKCQEQISDEIKTFIKETDEAITAYVNSSFVQNVNANILNAFQRTQAPGNMATVGKALGGLGGAAAGMAFAQYIPGFAAQFATPAISAFGQTAGSLVKFGVGTLLAEDAGMFSGIIGNEAGNFVSGLFRNEMTFGNKFASFLAGKGGQIVGKALGGFALLWSGYSVYKDNEKAKEAEQERSKIRADIKDKYIDLGANAKKDILVNVGKWFDENITPESKKFAEQIQKIRSEQENSKVKSEKLEQMLKRTDNLIGEIQACQN